jgi:hypothetical protein
MRSSEYHFVTLAKRGRAVPETSMRRILLASLALLGCAGHAPSPTPSSITTRTARAPVADTLQDTLLRAAHTRAMAAAIRVDTILVVATEFHLHIGQALDIDQLLVTPRNSSGGTVTDFAPVYVLVPGVVTLNGNRFQGHSVGEADLYVEAFPSAPPSVRPRPRPSTRVHFVVEP